MLRALGAGVKGHLAHILSGRGLELQHEVQGTLELLRSVTSRNADLIGDARLGRLREGAAGDLVVLGGDPFEHPSVLREPSDGRTVVLAGDVVR